MNNLRNIFLVSFLSLASSAHATSEEIMLEMIDYIEQNSDFVYNGEPLPSIEIHPAMDLCYDLYPADVVEAMEGQCHIAGYYMDPTKTVVIADDPGEFMVEEKFIETVLFHELVHYMQYINGEDQRVDCKNALELDAFILQDKYVQDMGFPEEQRPNMLFAIFTSTCNRSFWQWLKSLFVVYR